MSNFKFLYPYIQKYSVKLLFVIFLCTISAGLSLINPFIAGKIVKEVIEDGNYSILKNFILIMIIATLLRNILIYIFRLILETVSQNIYLLLREELFLKLQSQTFKFFDTTKVGDLMTRMTTDIDSIRHFIAYVIYMFYESVLIFTFGLLIIFKISWQTTLILSLILPFLFILARSQSKNIRPKLKKTREQFSRLNSVCQENISGNRVVKAFSREDFEIEKFDIENENYYKSSRDTNLVWIKYLPLIELCSNSLQLILIVVGGLLVITDNLYIWQLVTISAYLWAISNPLKTMAFLINDIQRCSTSIERVEEILTKQEEIKNPDRPISKTDILGEVEFKNVTFNYSENFTNPVLKNINFKVNKGEVVGILGSPGSGKTTMINLISRYYDTRKGSILIDGVNIKDYNLSLVRNKVSYAMQDVFLFSETVRNNITFANETLTYKQTKDFAIAADAHSFIEEMDNKYETIIGERGVGLSGGQKQRLSLARALASKPSILILDDTTSALDMETEYKIQQSLKNSFSGITTFIVANRISSVRHANLILILQNGEIIEKGTHQQLLSKKGYYFDLFAKQYNGGNVNV